MIAAAAPFVLHRFDDLVGDPLTGLLLAWSTPRMGPIGGGAFAFSVYAAGVGILLWALYLGATGLLNHQLGRSNRRWRVRWALLGWILGLLAILLLPFVLDTRDLPLVIACVGLLMAFAPYRKAR